VTTQGLFDRMPLVDPNLFEQLSKAKLVVRKGNLIYRRFTFDSLWSRDTASSKALSPLVSKHNGEGVGTLSLRTYEADVILG